MPITMLPEGGVDPTKSPARMRKPKRGIVFWGSMIGGLLFVVALMVVGVMQFIQPTPAAVAEVATELPPPGITHEPTNTITPMVMMPVVATLEEVAANLEFRPPIIQTALAQTAVAQGTVMPEGEATPTPTEITVEFGPQIEYEATIAAMRTQMVEIANARPVQPVMVITATQMLGSVYGVIVPGTGCRDTTLAILAEGGAGYYLLLDSPPPVDPMGVKVLVLGEIKTLCGQPAVYARGVTWLLPTPVVTNPPAPTDLPAPTGTPYPTPTPTIATVMGQVVPAAGCINTSMALVDTAGALWFLELGPTVAPPPGYPVGFLALATGTVTAGCGGQIIRATTVQWWPPATATATTTPTASPTATATP